MNRLMSWFSVGLVLLLFTPGLARAGVFFAIDDGRYLSPGVEDPNVYLVGQYPYGFDPATLSISFGPEQLDLSGEYLSNAAPNEGVFRTAINFYEGSLLSDTLRIDFTVSSPTQTDPNNVLVQLQFRSDSDDNQLQPLVGFHVDVQEVSGFMQLDSFIQQDGTVGDFSLSVQSPEPSTMVLLGSALLLIGGHRFLRWRRKR